MQKIKKSKYFNIGILRIENSMTGNLSIEK